MLEKVQSQISLFHTLYIICLVVCLLALALAIFFFIKFHIWDIFNIYTGRAEKKTVEKINEANAKTGTMRKTSASSQLKSSARKVATKDIIKDPTGTLENQNQVSYTGTAPAGQAVTSHSYNPYENQVAHNLAYNNQSYEQAYDYQSGNVNHSISGSEETTILESGIENTTVLQPEFFASEPTTVLNETLVQEIQVQSSPAPAGNLYNIEIAQQETDESHGKFKILDTVLLIHTNVPV